MFEKQV